MASRGIVSSRAADAGGLHPGSAVPRHSRQIPTRRRVLATVQVCTACGTGFSASSEFHSAFLRFFVAFLI